MTTTWDDVEAQIWRSVRDLYDGTGHTGRAAMDKIHDTIDAYAQAQPDPIRHHQAPDGHAGCKKPATARQLTRDRSEVTCGRCKRTRHYQADTLSTTTTPATGAPQ